MSGLIVELRTARARAEAAEAADDATFGGAMTSLFDVERKMKACLKRGGHVEGDTCWAVVAGELREIKLQGAHHA